MCHKAKTIVITRHSFIPDRQWIKLNKLKVSYRFIVHFSFHPFIPIPALHNSTKFSALYFSLFRFLFFFFFRFLFFFFFSVSCFGYFLPSSPRPTALLPDHPRPQRLTSRFAFFPAVYSHSIPSKPSSRSLSQSRLFFICSQSYTKKNGITSSSPVSGAALFEDPAEDVRR